MIAAPNLSRCRVASGPASRVSDSVRSSFSHLSHATQYIVWAESNDCQLYQAELRLVFKRSLRPSYSQALIFFAIF